MKKEIELVNPPITSYSTIANLMSLLWGHREKTMPWICDNFIQLFRIIGKVINCVISTDYPFIVIHGAVLSKDGYNYVFVGPTGAGKSTLSAYLSRKGYRYYSDDKSLINCNSGEIIPFFKPIHLRIDAKKYWRKNIK